MNITQDSAAKNIKARVRNQMPLHLIRKGKREIYTKNETVFLTPEEVKQYQHLIEICK